MLDKDINKNCLFRDDGFKDDRITRNIKTKNIQNDYNSLLARHKDFIRNYNLLQDNFLKICNKNDDLYEENKLLKNQNETLKSISKSSSNENVFIIDDLLYINFDIFEDSHYDLKRQNIYYEKYLSILDNIFVKYNINSLSELATILSNISNTFYINKYDNIFNILKSANTKLQNQKIKENELTNNLKDFDNKIKIIKNKISKLKPGTIIEIKGVKKIYKRKIEKTIDKIKQMEQEVNEYINSQLSWAKNILKNDINDEKLIKILDIFNKLIDNKYLLPSSDSENEHLKIYNDIKLFEVKKIDQYVKLGNLYINKNINTKKDLSEEDLIFMKEIIKTSDIKYGSKEERINRFISTCKRYYILSRKLSDKNSLINSKCKTYIRDMNNKDFDNLLKLLDNFEN